MEEPGPGEITLLLQEWRGGDQEAFRRLVPLVYDQLRAIAAGYLRRERVDHTLQATAVVHEVYLRLVKQRRAEWKDRAHFFTFAAKLMRMILADHARGLGAQKRSGGATHLPLSEDLAWLDAGGPEMLDLDRALHEMNVFDPRKVRLVELRCFLGCTMQESAEILEVSKATADRDLKVAKAWLFRRLRGPGMAPAELV